MNIKGPFLNRQRRRSKLKWYLSYFVPKLGPNGAAAVVDGRVVMQRERPHYESQDKANADKDRIAKQYGVAGAGEFVRSRAAQSDYDQARAILPGGVTALAAAQFYMQQNPMGKVVLLEEGRELFLAQREKLVGKTRHWKDLKWRTAAFAKAYPGRPAASIVRKEAMEYLLNLKADPRGKLNHKRALCAWGNWMIEAGVRTDNPFGGIKRKQLPKILLKEVEFLSLERVEKYLRAAERYDRELVAHEVIQFFAGVRADDEMASFRGEWVKAATREVVTPAEMTKTGKREVIDSLEENFWAWWKVYGREGLLRPANYKKRFWRIRILAQVDDRAQADQWVRLHIDTLVRLPEARALLRTWPWNARRRTFCTYHIAKHQSAAKTALILRQAATDSTTLHDSYRGLGVTPAMGAAYFALQPRRVKQPIRAAIVRRQTRSTVSGQAAF